MGSGVALVTAIEKLMEPVPLLLSNAGHSSKYNLLLVFIVLLVLFPWLKYQQRLWASQSIQVTQSYTSLLFKDKRSWHKTLKSQKPLV